MRKLHCTLRTVANHQEEGADGSWWFHTGMVGMFKVLVWPASCIQCVLMRRTVSSSTICAVPWSNAGTKIQLAAWPGSTGLRAPGYWRLTLLRFIRRGGVGTAAPCSLQVLAFLPVHVRLYLFAFRMAQDAFRNASNTNVQHAWYTFSGQQSAGKRG